MAALIDTGSTTTWIQEQVIPNGTIPTYTAPVRNQTMSGTFMSNTQVSLQDVKLPEFSPTRRIAIIQARVMSNTSPYDLIIGRDVITMLGLNLDFQENTILWDSIKRPMYKLNDIQHILHQPQPLAANLYTAQQFQETITSDCLAQVSIEDADYQPTSINDVVARCTHLNPQQQNDLHKLLSRFTKLFSGNLGYYPHEQIHLELKQDAQPVHKRSYVHTRYLKFIKLHLRKNLTDYVNLACLSSAAGLSGRLLHLSYPRKTAQSAGSQTFALSTRLLYVVHIRYLSSQKC